MIYSVWIALVVVHGYREKAPTIIDNLASREECVRVVDVITQNPRFSGRCIEVRKKG